MFHRISRLLVTAGVGALMASGCSTLEDTLDGGVETTQQEVAVAPAVTTAEPEPTTTTVTGYVSEGNGLSADELRQMVDAVVQSGGASEDVQPFGFTFPVDILEGGELQVFDVEIRPFSEPGEVRRSARLAHTYETLSNDELVEFYEEVAVEIGIDPESPIVDSTSDPEFILKDPMAGEQFKLVGSVQETAKSSIGMFLDPPDGNPSELSDPDMFSSWFDGLVPIPIEDGTYVSGGVEWQSSTGTSPGTSLLVDFDYPKRDELGLKDEIRELAEGYGLLPEEQNGNLVLENDEVVATYTFSGLTLSVQMQFKE